VPAEWLTLADAAVEADCSPVVLVEAMLAGELPYLRIDRDPPQWWIEHDQLKTWLARR
jgi:hypothetical protein